MKASRTFCNRIISPASRSTSRLHIHDFQILHIVAYDHRTQIGMLQTEPDIRKGNILRMSRIKTVGGKSAEHEVFRVSFLHIGQLSTVCIFLRAPSRIRHIDVFKSDAFNIVPYRSHDGDTRE